MAHVADVTSKPGRIRSDLTGDPIETKSNQTEGKLYLADQQTVWDSLGRAK